MEQDKIQTTNEESKEETKPKKRKKIVIPRRISQRRPSAERNNYLDKDEFASEIAKWRDSAEKVEDRVVHDKLALMVLSIPQHMLHSKCFCGYDYHLKEDMTMNAYLKIVKNLKNFNPAFGASAFKYFSRCCYFAFVETIMKFYKHKNMIEDLTAAVQHRLKSLGLTAGDLDDTSSSSCSFDERL